MRVPTPTESLGAPDSLAYNIRGPIGMSIDNRPHSENKSLV